MTSKRTNMPPPLVRRLSDKHRSIARVVIDWPKKGKLG